MGLLAPALTVSILKGFVLVAKPRKPIYGFADVLQNPNKTMRRVNCGILHSPLVMMTLQGILALWFGVWVNPRTPIRAAW